MAKRQQKTKSKAGYVYVLSNEAMPGIVKIGMTQRHPDQRLKEINSATGVLPFKVEAVIKSINAKWTERAVHEELTGKRVNDRREFFRIDVEAAVAIIAAVARQQKQVAFDRRSWNGGVPFFGGMLMTAVMMPVVAAFDFRLALPWIAICLFTALSGRRGALNEYLSIARRIPLGMLSSAAATALVFTAWHQGFTVDDVLVALQKLSLPG